MLEGALWKEQLAGITDSIVFIDEGNTFVKAEEFAGVIQNTDNYYVIVSRESLPALPYSVEEIYGIRTSGKYGTLKQIYHCLLYTSLQFCEALCGCDADAPDPAGCA